MMGKRKDETPRKHDGKRGHRAKSSTVARKRARRAKYATQGRG